MKSYFGSGGSKIDGEIGIGKKYKTGCVLAERGKKRSTNRRELIEIREKEE